MQCGGAILGAIVQQCAAIDQGNEQLIGLLGASCHRQRRLATFRAMEIRIEALGTHFGNLLHVAAIDAVEEATQIGACMQRLQLTFVQCEHFVHTALVLELQAGGEKGKIISCKIVGKNCSICLPPSSPRVH